jgi:hypothetical protein
VHRHQSLDEINAPTSRDTGDMPMPDDATADLSLLARQQQQILTEMGGMRDDLVVLTAIAMRQDGTLAALLAEVRAMHA